MAIYLDHNATCPLAPEVSQGIHEACLNIWGNPSSSHASGKKAKEAVDKARSQLANMIGSRQPEEITFVSGGTEANYLAMHSAIQSFKSAHPQVNKPHVISSNIEHVATTLPLMKWAEEGLIDVDFVPCDQNGRVEVENVVKCLIQNTCLVTVMMANNETGVIQPISELGKELEEINLERSAQGRHRILFHSDAAQSVGKIPVDIHDLKVDYLTIVGHKFYGPRIGALFHKAGSGNVIPVFIGGGQERGLRAGTENTPMIVGLGIAAELVTMRLAEDQQHLQKMKDLLVALLSEKLGEERFVENFALDPLRLPNTLSASFPGQLGHGLQTQWSKRIEASTAAACHSQDPGSQGSPILQKSGIDPELARGTVRLSVGRFTTIQEVIRASDCIAECVTAMSTHPV